MARPKKAAAPMVEPEPEPPEPDAGVAAALVKLGEMRADVKATVGTLGNDTERGALVARLEDVIATLGGA